MEPSIVAYKSGLPQPIATSGAMQSALHQLSGKKQEKKRKMLMIVYRRECEPVLLIQIMVILDKVYLPPFGRLRWRRDNRQIFLIRSVTYFKGILVIKFH